MLAKINRTYPSILDEFFGRDFYPVHYRSNGFKSLPAVNISEGDDEYTIEVAAPGLEKKDFKIDLENDCLTISSVRVDNTEDNQDQYTRREFRYNGFSRSFTLPEGVDADNVTASHKNGVLSVNIPKKEEAKAKPARQIAIK
ncbi:MAG: Hsp20/alpha crystallin family protein [Bacteroidales bacterium]|nr:Hsp20/alpha crystallin family protein [Bacteroidales bacterium]